MRACLALAILFAASAPALAAGRLPYGSRVGMEVTVTRVEGIGSERAVIQAEHRRENAKEFCVEYSDDKSEGCVTRTLRDVRLSDTVRGNCKTGVFTTFGGATFRFVGALKTRDEFAPKYRILGPDGQLDGSSAFGYSEALVIYDALCPGRVDIPR